MIRFAHAKGAMSITLVHDNADIKMHRNAAFAQQSCPILRHGALISIEFRARSGKNLTMPHSCGWQLLISAWLLLDDRQSRCSDKRSEVREEIPFWESPERECFDLESTV